MAGVSLTPNDSSPFLVAVVSATATTALIAGVTNKIVRVYKLFLVASGTTTVTFFDGTASGTALNGGIPFVANGSIVLDLDGTSWFTGSMGNAFTMVSSGSAITVSGAVYYTQQPFYG